MTRIQSIGLTNSLKKCWHGSVTPSTHTRKPFPSSICLFTRMTPQSIQKIFSTTWNPPLMPLNASLSALTHSQPLNKEHRHLFLKLFLFSFYLGYSLMYSPHACLRCSDDDLRGIKETMHSILIKGALPNLIKLISSFTQDVITNRRGIANTLFGWFKTSSSTNLLNTMANDESISLYNDQAIEFKIRFIADMAFLFEVTLDCTSNT